MTMRLHLLRRSHSHTRKVGLMILTLLAISSSPSQANDDDLFDPPGKLYDVGGHRLHIHCVGTPSDQPTVIIDAGLGSFSLEWYRMQAHLSAHTHSCSYDRAGYGWSDPGPFPRTTETLVDELHILLNAAEVAPPYLLIGHSFGGYNMMYFAKKYADEVRGLILVDSSHPDQTAWMPSVFPESAASRGRTRFVSMPKLPDNYPYESRILGYHLMNAYKARNALRYESMNFEISARQVTRLGDLPSMPLIVLTRGERAWPDTPEGKEREDLWTRLQNGLARMSPQSQHIYAKYSGHYIHLDQPLLVEKAIRSVLQETECGKPVLMVSAEVESVGEC